MQNRILYIRTDDLPKTPLGEEQGGGSGAFEIPVTSKVVNNVTTYTVDSSISSTDIYNHKRNLVLILDNRLVYPFKGGNDSGPLAFDYYFSLQEIGDGQVETEWLKIHAEYPTGNLSVTPYSMDFAPPSEVTVDSALSSTSENPVQNKVVKAAFDDINGRLDNVVYWEDGASMLYPAEQVGLEDIGSYYTGDTVEAALQEIGAELAGVSALIGTGVIT